MLLLSFFPHAFNVSLCNPTSQFQSSSPPFPLHFLGICSLCQCSSPILSKSPAHVNISHANFFFKLYLTPTSTLSSFFLLLSAVITHKILFIRLVSQTWTFFCCFSVSGNVSSAFMHAGETHEQSTFNLRLRLSPITLSTFLQAFAPAVMLVVTKLNDLVDFEQGN